MTNPLFATPLILLLAGASAAPPAPERPDWEQASVALQHITILVPRVTVSSTSTTIITRTAPRPPAFREKKADDCVKLKKVKGFSVNARDSVDLRMEDGDLLRAKLGSNCPAIGFYAGFYVKPKSDGKMCVKRDVLRSRAGTSCTIEAFRKLVPEK